MVEPDGNDARLAVSGCSVGKSGVSLAIAVSGQRPLGSLEEPHWSSTIRSPSLLSLYYIPPAGTSLSLSRLEDRTYI